MATERQIAANRENAKKSTGPRQAAGKSRASRNAVRHGLARAFGRYAEDIRSIERLAQIISTEAGSSMPTARAVAVVECELVRIRSVRAETLAALNKLIGEGTADVAILKGIGNAQSICRYERRATARKKRAYAELAERTQISVTNTGQMQ